MLWIRSADGRPLTVTEAAATRPGITVRFEKVEAVQPAAPADGQRPVLGPRPGDWRLVVSADPAAGPRTEAGEVRIATDHPDLPRLDLPLRVRIRPRFRVLPPRLVLRRPAGAAPFDARVTVRHGAGRRFRLASASLVPPLEGVTLAVPGEGERRSTQVVSLHVAPGDAPRHATATLRLVVRDGGQEREFTVPVELHVAAAGRPAHDATVSQSDDSR
ncbi:MAG: hypothetical protein Kow0062_18840 [Acidobacteriota bacterium]